MYLEKKQRNVNLKGRCWSADVLKRPKSDELLLQNINTTF